MDRTFMRQYYEEKYDEECFDKHRKKLEYVEAEKQHRLLEEKLKVLIGGENTPAWGMYEECMMAYIDLVDILRKESYLLGAEDREKMIR